MVPSQIEREVLIEAPIDDVWQIVTEPEHITQWFAKECELDRHSGRLTFESGQTFYLHVVAFEPPHRFAYRWLHEQGTQARKENSMLVEFTLQAEDGRTRLRVVESGFDQVDWTDDAKTSYFDDHSRGWDTLIGRLRDYAKR
ncbi:MAG TPA: SRPBCC domain-containing protein [Candidatus Dormibacteraeota bacterium]|nr:SRPBCC domain-containing protein [Candidatus Dormibacteraeota bacterium]